MSNDDVLMSVALDTCKTLFVTISLYVKYLNKLISTLDVIRKISISDKSWHDALENVPLERRSFYQGRTIFESVKQVLVSVTSWEGYLKTAVEMQQERQVNLGIGFPCGKTGQQSLSLSVAMEDWEKSTETISEVLAQCTCRPELEALILDEDYQLLETSSENYAIIFQGCVSALEATSAWISFATALAEVKESHFRDKNVPDQECSSKASTLIGEMSRLLQTQKEKNSHFQLKKLIDKSLILKRCAENKNSLQSGSPFKKMMQHPKFQNVVKDVELFMKYIYDVIKDLKCRDINFNFEEELQTASEKQEFFEELSDINLPIAADMLDKIMKQVNDDWERLLYLQVRFEIAMRYDGSQVARGIGEEMYRLAKDIHEGKIQVENSEYSKRLAISYHILACMNCSVVIDQTQYRRELLEAKRYLEEAAEIALCEGTERDKTLLYFARESYVDFKRFYNNVINPQRSDKRTKNHKTLIKHLVGKFYRQVDRHSVYKSAVHPGSFLQDTLDVAEEEKDARAMASARIQLAQTYEGEGRYSEALENILKSVMYMLMTGDLAALLTVFPFLINTHNNLGNIEDVLKYCLIVDEIATKTDFGFDACILLTSIASPALYRLGFHVEANDLWMYFVQAIRNQVDKYFGIATGFEALGRYEEALKYLQRYKPYIDVTNRGSRDELFHLALLFTKNNDLKSAERCLKSVISRQENFRPKLGQQDISSLASFETDILIRYEFLQELLIENNQYLEALVKVEFSRGRSITDLMQQNVLGNERISQIYSKWASSYDSEEVKVTTEILDEFLKAADKFQTNFIVYSLIQNSVFITRQSAPKTVWICIWLVKCKGSSCQDTQRIVFRTSFVDLDTLPIEPHSIGGLFRELAHRLRGLSVYPEGIKDTTNLFDQFSQERESTERSTGMERITLSDEVSDISRILYDLCIEPIASSLPMAHGDAPLSITIIPDRFLCDIPFCALKSSSGHFLIETCTISYAPSLLGFLMLDERFQYLKEKQNTTNEKLRVAAFGNAVTKELQDLPSSEKEISCIEKIFEEHLCSTFLQHEAKKDILMKHLDRCDVLHIATHASSVVYKGLGEFSYGSSIYLTPSDLSCSGILTAQEIMKSSSNCLFVCLSCCETGKGTPTSDISLGLHRAFLAAGASAVLMTRWSIADRFTSVMMDVFYTYIKEGMTITAALQRVMCDNVRAGVSPSLWSCFSFYGTPNALILSPVSVCNKSFE
ncbi:tetratricopeptide repeat protein 28-like [Limulus polyphemus]|uniref:Tetratricopeptide repeat protein 28-like n=1 Tax=Limulus polyphemus TaxID=6850 RepID=A0ABM1BUN0_LIMPO|nr:tetratricopeptide repeat protein 28-like [Limulus polyphemus]